VPKLIRHNVAVYNMLGEGAKPGLAPPGKTRAGRSARDKTLRFHPQLPEEE